WVLSAIYFVAAMVVSRSLRESLMKRLAGFSERDEREEQVTASAARATFLLMLSIEVVGLLMTLTKVSLDWDPVAKGPKGLLSIRVGFRPEHWNTFAFAVEKAAASGPQWTWATSLLPPNMALPMLALILLQLAGFRIFARRSGL